MFPQPNKTNCYPCDLIFRCVLSTGMGERELFSFWRLEVYWHIGIRVYWRLEISIDFGRCLTISGN